VAAAATRLADAVGLIAAALMGAPDTGLRVLRTSGGNLWIWRAEPIGAQSTEVTLVSWAWLNFPLAALFFLAMTAIPLWLVVKRPDNGPSFAAVPADARIPAISAVASAEAVPDRSAAARPLSGARPVSGTRPSAAGGLA